MPRSQSVTNLLDEYIPFTAISGKCKMIPACYEQSSKETAL